MILRHRKSLEQANITVEAAFVMPIVLFTVFALIYLAFFLHDRCLVQGTVDNVLHKASITVKHNADIESGAINYEEIGERGVFYLIFGDSEAEQVKLENYLKTELTKGLFLSRIANTEVQANQYKITIQVEMAADVTIPIFSHLFDQYKSIKITETCPVHNPAETIRAAEVNLKTGSEIKGMDEMKKKIEDLLGTESE